MRSGLLKMLYYLLIINTLVILGINSQENKQQQIRGSDVPHKMVWDNKTSSFIKDFVTLPGDSPTLKSTYWNILNPLNEKYRVGTVLSSYISLQCYDYLSLWLFSDLIIL